MINHHEHQKGLLFVYLFIFSLLSQKDRVYHGGNDIAWGQGQKTVDYGFIHTQEIERGMEEEGREGKREREREFLYRHMQYIYSHEDDMWKYMSAYSFQSK